MPDSKAKTKPGKQRFVAKAMGEFKAGAMKSGSGETVTDPNQAIAIALNQTGQSRPARKTSATARLSGAVGRRLAARDRR